MTRLGEKMASQKQEQSPVRRSGTRTYCADGGPARLQERDEFGTLCACLGGSGAKLKKLGKTYAIQHFIRMKNTVESSPTSMPSIWRCRIIYIGNMRFALLRRVFMCSAKSRWHPQPRTARQ